MKKVVEQLLNTMKFLSPYFKFFPDLFKYLKLRGRQVWIWLNLIIEFFLIVGGNLKKEIVQRMFWGRASFYRQIFHVVIISITVVTLVSGVSARIAQLDSMTEEGISSSAAHIGANDMILQYANARVFTVKGVEDLPFDLVNHEVKQGETLEQIAKEYKIDDVTSIVWANGLDPFKPIIKPGQVLVIPPMKGVLKEAKENETARTIVKGVKDANMIDVIELNNLSSVDEVIEKGRLIFIPNGNIPLRPPDQGTKSGGDPNVVDVPDSGFEIPKGTFVNPVGDASCEGYSMSRGYSSYHTGVDLVKSDGCWIRAAAPGTVIYARWNSGGLGFAVVIEHANGLRTLYGHGNGTFAVREGEEVQAGQKIMYMGNTGHSFGTHLHFSLSSDNKDVLNCYSCRINPAGIVPY